MTGHFWLGMVVVLLGGLLNGSFAFPLRYSRSWRWENSWLVFAVLSLILMPCSLAVVFVPQIREVYSGASASALIYPLLFGFLWGIAQLTFGLAIRAVGLAFAMSVVAGLSCLSGSLVPLLLFNPHDLLRPRGLLLLVSLPILFTGLGLYGKAGKRREKEQSPAAAPGSVPQKAFATGLAICIFTGIVGSSINIGFAFGDDLIRRSLRLGATQTTSTYAVWALVLAAGSIPSLLYCLFLLVKNRTWSSFLLPGCGKEVLVAGIMSLLWLAGIFTYGIGTKLVGVYGISLGFALFTAAQILSANTLGMVAGEWSGTTLYTKKLIAVAAAVTLASVLVLNLGGIWQ